MESKIDLRKEKKENVSFRRRDERIQILNLNTQFSLEKGVQGKDMFGNRTKGFDTFQQRMQDIENDINGVRPQTPKMGEVLRLTIKDANNINAEPGFLLNLNRWIVDSTRVN